MSARNRELLGLIPASLLVTAGFAAVFIQQGSQQLSNLSLTYGAIFLGLCVAAHVFLRIALPYADPYLFPLVAVLASFGLVVIYRIDETLARQQAQWFVAGLLLFVATIVFVRDYRKLEQYRYLIAAGSLVLLCLPRLPGIGAQVNGAYLGVRIPGVFIFQPTEFAKIGIVIFLASYLRDTRQLLVAGARRVAGITLPPLKHFGPLLVIWGVAMLLLIVIRDLGSSLMFFGAFLAVLYVATSRVSFVVVGLALFGLGAWYLGTHVPHVVDRVDVWLDPFNAHRYPGVGYQIANSLFAQSDGGLLGRGFGEAFLVLPGGGPLLPAPQTDLIYAVIVNELGLVGAVAVLTTYLLFVQRGFKIALLARDSFSTLLAVGLSAVFALQVFVIVGGVTNVIPLTGVTLPFISYGGSSLLANFVLLALLLLVSDRAREARVSTPIMRLFGTIVVLFAILVFWTSRWSVLDAKDLRDNALNKRPLLAQLHVKRGAIKAGDGSVLARSVRREGGTYGRTYPDGSLFGHPVGYAIVALNQLAGIERYRNDELSGQGDELGSLADQLQGKRQQGDTVVTTLDPAAQRIATDQLNATGSPGAVVALDPRTGAVLVMASTPGYDPNALNRPGVFRALNSAGSGAPLLDRSTQSSYAPGSTFKVLTAAAAIDTGRYTPDSVINGDSPKVISGVPMRNDLGESFGDITLTDAMTNSVNTVFGQIGEALGKQTMAGYMRRFGFYRRPPLDYPADEMLASGERLNGKLLPVTSDQVDVGRMAIGQDKLAVTPMQMAMVVSAVANRGRLMAPHLADRIVDPDGRVVKRVGPQVASTPISANTADEVNQMMRTVVESGTGTAVQLPGIQVAGKTGTAEIGTPGSNLTQPSFVAFAPADNPRIAIAVTVERSQGGFGGTVAAPIARAVLESLLN